MTLLERRTSGYSYDLTSHEINLTPAINVGFAALDRSFPYLERNNGARCGRRMALFHMHSEHEFVLFKISDVGSLHLLSSSGHQEWRRAESSQDFGAQGD